MVARRGQVLPKLYNFCPAHIGDKGGCASAPDKNGWGGANHYSMFNFILAVILGSTL